MLDPALGNWETFYNAMGVPNGNLDPLGNGSNVGFDQRELLVVVDGDPSDPRTAGGIAAAATRGPVPETPATAPAALTSKP